MCSKKKNCGCYNLLVYAKHENDKENVYKKIWKNMWSIGNITKKKTVKENRKNQVDDWKVNSKRCADILCVLLTHT